MLALVVDTSTHPRAICYKCYNESISSHTRLALNEFRASCYSHHRSQCALSETNWLLRVSGCNPYLESLPSYIDGAPPWTPTNKGHGITSRPLKHDPEVSPKDSKELCTDSYQIYSYNQVTVIMHSIPWVNICNQIPICIPCWTMPTHSPISWAWSLISYQFHCHFHNILLIPFTC